MDDDFKFNDTNVEIYAGTFNFVLNLTLSGNLKSLKEVTTYFFHNESSTRMKIPNYFYPDKNILILQYIPSVFHNNIPSKLGVMFEYEGLNYWFKKSGYIITTL